MTGRRPSRLAGRLSLALVSVVGAGVLGACASSGGVGPVPAKDGYPEVRLVAAARDADAWVARALGEWSAGRVAAAEGSVREGLALDPEHPRGLVVLGRALGAQGAAEEALGVLRWVSTWLGPTAAASLAPEVEAARRGAIASALRAGRTMVAEGYLTAGGREGGDAMRRDVADAWLGAGEPTAACRVAGALEGGRPGWFAPVCEGDPTGEGPGTEATVQAVMGLIAAGRQDEGLALARGATGDDAEAAVLRAIAAMVASGSDAEAVAAAAARALARAPAERAAPALEALIDAAVRRKKPEVAVRVAAALVQGARLSPREVGAALAMGGLQPDAAVAAPLRDAFRVLGPGSQVAFLDGLRAGGATAFVRRLAEGCDASCPAAVRLAALEAAVAEGGAGRGTPDLRREAAALAASVDALRRGERTRLGAVSARLGLPPDFRLDPSRPSDAPQDPARILEPAPPDLSLVDRLDILDAMVALGAEDLAAAVAREGRRDDGDDGEDDDGDDGVAGLSLDAELVRLGAALGDQVSFDAALGRLLSAARALPSEVLARLSRRAVRDRPPTLRLRVGAGVLEWPAPGAPSDGASLARDPRLEALVRRALPACRGGEVEDCRQERPSALRRLAESLDVDVERLRDARVRRAMAPDADPSAFESVDVLGATDLAFQVAALGAFAALGHAELAALTARAIAANEGTALKKTDRRLVKRAAELALGAGLPDAAWAILEPFVDASELRLPAIVALIRLGRPLDALELARRGGGGPVRRGANDGSHELVLAMASEGAAEEALTLALEALDEAGARGIRGAAAIELARRSRRPDLVEAVARRLVEGGSASTDTWERAVRALLEAGLGDVADALLAAARRDRPSDGSLRDLHLTTALSRRDGSAAIALLDEVLGDRRVRGPARLLALRRVAESGLPGLWREAARRAAGAELAEGAWRVNVLALGGEAAEAQAAARAVLASHAGSREAVEAISGALFAGGRPDLLGGALASSLAGDGVRSDAALAAARGAAEAGDLERASRGLERLADEGGGALLDTVARAWWEAGEAGRAAAVWRDLVATLDTPLEPGSLGRFAAAVARSGPPPGLGQALRVRAAAGEGDAAQQLGLARVALEAGLSEVAGELLARVRSSEAWIERARLAMATGDAAAAAELWLERIDQTVSATRGGRRALERALPQATLETLARIDALEPHGGPTHAAVLAALIARSGLTAPLAAHLLFGAIVRDADTPQPVVSVALSHAPSGGRPDAAQAAALGRLIGWTRHVGDASRHREVVLAWAGVSPRASERDVDVAELVPGGAPERAISLRGHGGASLATRLGASGLAVLARSGLGRLAAEGARHEGFRSRAGLPSPVHRAAIALAAPDEAVPLVFNPFDDAVTAVHVALALGDVRRATAIGLPLLRSTSPYLDVASERAVLAAIGAEGDVRTIDRALDLLETRPVPAVASLRTALGIFDEIGAEVAAGRVRARLAAAGAMAGDLAGATLAEALAAPASEEAAALWGRVAPRQRLRILVGALKDGVLTPDRAGSAFDAADLPAALEGDGRTWLAALSGAPDLHALLDARDGSRRADIAEHLSRRPGRADGANTGASLALRLTEGWPDAPRTAVEARVRAAMTLGDTARLGDAVDELVRRWPAHLPRVDLLQRALCHLARSTEGADAATRLFDHVLRQPPAEAALVLRLAALGTAERACTSLPTGADGRDAASALAGRLRDHFGVIDGGLLASEVLRFAGDHPGAVSLADDVARLSPRGAPGRLARAQSAWLRGDEDTAHREIARILRLGGGGPLVPDGVGVGADAVRGDALVLRARLEAEAGDRARARATLAAARAITSPAELARHAEVALALAELGPADASARERAVCLRLAPGLPACGGDRDHPADGPAP